MQKQITAIFFVLALGVMSCPAQTTAPAPDPWQPLKFLTGTWEARTSNVSGGATAGAQVVGVYSFNFELNNHILARHSSSAGCKAPTDFDCEHRDLLYLYTEGPEIKATYFDNEGHVIHYNVTTPTAASAIFVSDPSTPGPQFRLVYERKDAILSGKFQMRMPGKSDFQSYLEWSGSKK
jgi:hypothetical protein